jgi:superfamily II RNA helicase
MAGRAGRRGIDTIGYVVTMVERGFTDLEKLKQMALKDDIPIQSQFKLSINTVLNLYKSHTPQEREIILRMNFDYFLKQQHSTTQVRIMATYNNKVKILKQMGFIRDEKLTEKGEFATKIYSEEILITEIFCSDAYKSLSDSEINILVAAIIYEPRGKDYFTMKGIDQTYNRIMKALVEKEYVMKNVNKLHVKRMIRVIGGFSDGSPFKDLLDSCNLDEGDLIRLFRRIIDMLRQIRHASTDHDLIDTLRSCHEKVYRDVIRFEF